MLALVILTSILLGLRHAADPDHLAAVTTLIASGREQASRAAGMLGLFWGLGHALTLAAFGLPVIWLRSFLPDRAQHLAETAIALVIVLLAFHLLRRWRQGAFHTHPHSHEDGSSHAHIHSHAHGRGHEHAHAGEGSRRPHVAFAIGALHGFGGSAGVAALLLASIETKALAVLALLLLALGTVLSMWAVTTGFGLTLARRPLRPLFAASAPVLGAASLGFGIWYGTAAWLPL